MAIELTLRFRGLNLAVAESVEERSLISLAQTITSFLGQSELGQSGDRQPWDLLSTLLDQVETLFPTLGGTDPLTTLRQWPAPTESASDPADPSDSSSEFPATMTAEQRSALDWLKDLLEGVVGQAIRPALDQIQTAEANELLNGLPDRVEGEIFRVGFWIGRDRSARKKPFNAIAAVDDALEDYWDKQASPPATPLAVVPPPVSPLPIPEHFRGDRLDSVWRVPYQTRALEAKDWADHHKISPAGKDEFRTALVLIDVQNTFCLPDFELFVGGQSGTGAVDDNRRLCEFIYRNLHRITDIIPTLDTHGAAQIFHPAFWVDANGRSPEPMTMISAADVESGRWRVNPHLRSPLQGQGRLNLQDWALHYVTTLEQAGKYPLTVWPFHSILGGIGHALVSAVEEAVFFHAMARHSPTQYELKGENPLTENYSALRPEVGVDADGRAIAEPNQRLIHQLLEYDRVIIAGQAKSHCVAWTVADLLEAIQDQDPAIAQKVYLLEDCTSPVVVPGVVDFSAVGDRAFADFAAAGMHRVLSTDSF